jgi:hypothetical protein
MISGLRSMGIFLGSALSFPILVLLGVVLKVQALRFV